MPTYLNQATNIPELYLASVSVGIVLLLLFVIYGAGPVVNLIGFVYPV